MKSEIFVSKYKKKKYNRDLYDITTFSRRRSYIGDMSIY